MTSRAKELVTEIVAELENQATQERFTLDPVLFKKSYGHAYTLESLERFPVCYVRCTTKTQSPAGRSDIYRSEYTITIEIVAALVCVNELNDGGTIEELEQLVDFAEQVERAMKEFCSSKASCTLLGITSDPLYEADNLESMNAFRSIQNYMYTITERNTFV
jgi:hypothetical protein